MLHFFRMFSYINNLSLVSLTQTHNRISIQMLSLLILLFSIPNFRKLNVYSFLIYTVCEQKKNEMYACVYTYAHQYIHTYMSIIFASPQYNLLVKIICFYLFNFINCFLLICKRNQRAPSLKPFIIEPKTMSVIFMTSVTHHSQIT